MIDLIWLKNKKRGDRGAKSFKSYAYGYWFYIWKYSGIYVLQYICSE